MQDSSLARKFAALADLGFTRQDRPPAALDAVPVDGGDWKVVLTRPAMGTVVSITAIGPDAGRAEDAIGAAVAEMDRLVALLSRYEPDSAVSCLNDSGHVRHPPDELKQVVAAALDYHRLSHGAFEVSITPVLELFERQAGDVPDPATLREALARVGSSHIEVGWRRIRLGREGMCLTLDGIAKGYIVDAVAETLEDHGIRRYLINAGGDVRSRRCKEGGRPWEVAVRSPDDGAAFVDTIALTNAAVATSGSYEIRFDRDEAFHHIVDARIGDSPRQARSVSVVAPTAMAADALATSVFVLGPTAGIDLVDRLRGCACLVLDRTGRRWTSSRWQSTRSPCDQESM